MSYNAEQYWAQMEGLRVRVMGLCRHGSREELASLDAEFRELQEQVWSSLREAEKRIKAPTHVLAAGASKGVAAPTLTTD
jgi:hypothetical protein